jgi:5-methylthioadenosine/S-adenosylhomocysteine deaminase
VADALDARVAAREADAGPLVEVAVSPHAPYTVAPHVFVEVVRRAREQGRWVVTHLAESDDELAALRDGSGPLVAATRRTNDMVEPLGKHPIVALAELGVLGPETIVAHAVKAGPDEIALLAASGCSVAHCPRSNALLGCGIAPVPELRAAGVPVGLGTDGPSSALTLDMLDEMRTAIFVARARAEHPSALSAEAALRLATLGGAEALRRDHELGSLDPGKAADLVVVDLSGSTFSPTDDPVAALVLGAAPSDVILTIVSGGVRYRRESPRYAQALARAAEARRRMLTSVEP